MVSIILPNLNTPLAFLDARVKSILDQDYKDWECIVIDGISDNGSFEYIQEKAFRDKRFFFYQRPAKGIYDAWNEGIKLAKGDYIYIATSDDLFTADFLEKMVKALGDNLDCGLAHCCLDIINEHGQPAASQWHDWEKVKFFGNYINQYHKRIAPYDAIVHFGWSTVYSSIVQLLIRRNLFEETGYFNTEYGAAADFEWGLRAALSASVAHIPLYLASWRKHAAQATDDNNLNKPAFYGDLIKMARSALNTIENKKGIILTNQDALYFNYLFQQFNLTAKSRKLQFLFKSLLEMPRLTAKLIVYRFWGTRFDTTSFISAQLAERNLMGPVNV